MGGLERPGGARPGGGPTGSGGTFRSGRSGRGLIQVWVGRHVEQKPSAHAGSRSQNLTPSRQVDRSQTAQLVSGKDCGELHKEHCHPVWTCTAGARAAGTGTGGPLLAGGEDQQNPCQGRGQFAEQHSLGGAKGEPTPSLGPGAGRGTVESCLRASFTSSPSTGRLHQGTGDGGGGDGEHHLWSHLHHGHIIS